MLQWGQMRLGEMQSLARRTQLAGVGGGIWILTHMQVRCVWYHLVAGGGVGYTLARVKATFKQQPLYCTWHI